jgi:DNA polymerase III subunit gamma/tau
LVYQSLYRKYRPQRFSELVGQAHVVNALRSAVRDDRVGHAYLFSGPRGTGKTTTARILAKALNCTDLGADGEPCGVCANCVAVTAGTFFDLFELDAASNRGIDDIRGVVESTALGIGPGARTKVFVLDEVHMLTDAASNALLKTLEEAPTHVVFVLATTNPEKVLPTIRSRTQHFEFTLLSTDELVARLADLSAREGVEADPEALTVIATAGAGSARDAESLLDQALAHGTGRLDGEVVAALFGGTAFAARTRILESIAQEDASGALIGLAELLDTGHEPRRVAEDLLAAARDAFLLSAAGGRVQITAPEDQLGHLRALGESLGNAALVRVIETVGQAVTDMRGAEAADPRLVLEVALVRLSRRDAGPPLQTVVERIERLERAVGGASSAPPVRAARSTPSVPATPPVPTPPAPDAPAVTEPPVPTAAVPAEPAARERRPTIGALRRESGATAPEAPAMPAAPPTPETLAPTADADSVDLDDVIVAWSEIVPMFSPATRSAVQQAQPLRFEGDVLVFGVAPQMLGAARDRFRSQADIVREALSDKLGKRFKFKLEPAPQFALDGPPGGGTTDGPITDAADEPPPDDGHPPDAEPPSEVVDTEDLTEVPPEADPPPVNRLRDELGATVVEEVPRD